MVIVLDGCIFLDVIFFVGHCGWNIRCAKLQCSRLKEVCSPDIFLTGGLSTFVLPDLFFDPDFLTLFFSFLEILLDTDVELRMIKQGVKLAESVERAARKDEKN